MFKIQIVNLFAITDTFRSNMGNCAKMYQGIDKNCDFI